MNALLFGGALDGQTLDIHGTELHNLVSDRGRQLTEVYLWQIVGDERFLVLNEVREGWQ